MPMEWFILYQPHQLRLQPKPRRKAVVHSLTVTDTLRYVVWARSPGHIKVFYTKSAKNYIRWTSRMLRPFNVNGYLCCSNVGLMTFVSWRAMLLIHCQWCIDVDKSLCSQTHCCLVNGNRSRKQMWHVCINLKHLIVKFNAATGSLMKLFHNWKSNNAW